MADTSESEAVDTNDKSQETEAVKPSSETSVTEEKNSAPLNSSSSSAQPSKQKIDILLKAAGDAPIMKKKKWAVEPDKKIASIIEFIRKYLKLDPSESLFLYVNQAFAPPPDQIIKNLYECFETDGKLVLHYCRTQAWG